MRTRIHPKKTMLLLIGIFVIFAYAITVGLRDSSVGSDSVNYRSSFESSVGGGFESGFNLIIIFLKYFSDSYHFFFAIIAILTGLLFFLAGKTLFTSRYVLLFTIFLITFPFFYSITSNVVRQGLAIGIILFSYSITSQIKTKINYKLLILILFTGYIHLPTAAIMLPLVVNFKMKKIIFIWISLMMLSLLSNYYAPLLSSLISGRFIAYLTNGAFTQYVTGFRWQFVMFSAMPFLLLLLTKHNDMSESYRKIYEGYFLINGISLLLNFLPYFDRFLLPSWMMMPFIYTCAIIEVNLKRLGYRSKLVICLTLFSTVLSASLVVFRVGVS